MPRCIIVDDHGDTRTGYAEFLGAFGIEVKTAADAEELRRLLDDWLPDAIVLDLQLPRTDGWELTREIKGDPRTRHVAIVVVSACVMPAERAAAEVAGCDAFISKPCDPMLIIDELRRLTGGTRSAIREPGAQNPETRTDEPTDPSNPETGNGGPADPRTRERKQR